MWRNYLTVGFRALAKNKTYAFINIFGLALGLAACLLILLFVRYEMSYDSWMPESERAYQLQAWYEPTDSGGEEMKLQMSAFVSRDALVKDFPQIEKAVYVASGRAVIMQDGQPSYAERFNFVDGNLFEILQIPFVHGNRATALDLPNSVVLTQSEAEKRFGSRNPVGQTLTLSAQGEMNDYIVTGVVQDLPKNSHLDLGVIARFDPQSFYADNPHFLSSWNSQGGWVYVRLSPGADAEDINSQLPAWEKRNIPDDTHGAEAGEVSNPGDQQNWQLVNVEDVHLGEGQRASMTPGNDYRTIFTFAVIALLILGMAVVNFTNLATARASQRAREVALRKVMGASRKQLIFQFLAESILVTGLAMVVALAMVELLLPSFNSFLDAGMTVVYWGADGILLPILLLVLLVGATAGLYPAFYLSRFQPAKVLKANKSSADAQGSGQLRNVLVVSQFAVSIGLIICTAVIYGQTLYARTADAGYKRDGLLQIQNVAADEVGAVLDSLKQEIARIDGVEAVSRTGIGVNPNSNAVTSVYLDGNPNPVPLGTYGIDTDFFPTMGMKLLAGRNFTETIAMDDATTPFPLDPEAERAIVRRGVNVVMSELAAERLGFEPSEAIGKQLKAALTYPEFGLVPATIVGVVKDARFRSVRDPLQPIMFYYARNFHNALMVRYDSPNPNQVMRSIEATWKRMIPTVPFTGEFVDDRVRQLYDRDEARGQLFAAFAILAIVIGCLGLFGLAAFTAERRTKEIGIRKVLGARTRDIVQLLAWQFSKPVIIANLIAWPIAWWVMRDWLNNFDARIDLGPGPFILAGALALVIAIGTIAGHSFKVARANPIQALRYE